MFRDQQSLLTVIESLKLYINYILFIEILVLYTILKQKGQDSTV